MAIIGWIVAGIGLVYMILRNRDLTAEVGDIRLIIKGQSDAIADMKALHIGYKMEKVDHETVHQFLGSDLNKLTERVVKLEGKKPPGLAGIRKRLTALENKRK